MFFRRIALMFLSFIMMLTPGCREYHYYRYKAVVVEMLGGELTINLEGTYSENYKKDGKKFADWGFPYNLQFMLSLPFEHNFLKLAVKDIALIGKKSSRHFSFSDIESYKVKDPRLRSNPNARGKTVMTSVRVTHDTFEYETYILKATVVVYENSETFKEKMISVLIETDFKKESRSDWFDKKMSQ